MADAGRNGLAVAGVQGRVEALHAKPQLPIEDLE
jgi:hypothetical protein